MRHVLFPTIAFLFACNPQPDTMTDGGGDAGPSECPPLTGTGTMHSGTITTPDTWTAAGSPHVIASDTSIRTDITLEACAVVRIGDGKTLDVRGSLVANGLPTKPVTIERLDPAKPWAQIKAYGGTLKFVNTKVVGGGAPLNAPLDVAAAIDIRTTDQLQPPLETFHAEHVTIDGSASMGISVREGAGFSAASTDLVIKGSANVPIRTWASAAGSIPNGSYTGNARDQIVLEGGGGPASIVRDVTFHDRGVPYRVGDSIVEGKLQVDSQKNGTVATLTIEPGVIVRFKKNGSMYMQYAQNVLPATGALVAVGTATTPIVFTSDEAAPAAGDWLGLHFDGTPDPKSRLDFVRVEFAGGVTSDVGASCKYPDNINNAAAIRIFGEPQTEFVTNTTIVSSGRHGFDRGWRGTPNISFLPTNTFMAIAKCQESYPSPTMGACPTNPYCPM